MIRDKFQSVKTHIQENKTVYVTGGVCFVIGVAGTVMFTKYGNSSKINMMRFWSHGDNNIMSVFINPLGDPGNVVQCVETGTVYASQGQAARELGVNVARISEHLNGKLPNVKGLHLIILGKAGQPLAE